MKMTNRENTALLSDYIVDDKKRTNRTADEEIRRPGGR